MGTLYENIAVLCEERGIKPGKMCNDTQISRGLITDLKMGRKSSITVDTAQKIADYFGVSVDRILGAEQKEKPTLQMESEPFPGYSDLTDEEKKKVSDYIDLLLAARKK
jgi:transcriptional regulator with XRE-family HTH domain